MVANLKDVTKEALTMTAANEIKLADINIEQQELYRLVEFNDETIKNVNALMGVKNK